LKYAQRKCALNALVFSSLIFAGSAVAGLLGSLTGLGGGVIIVPLLTLGFGVDVRYAIGASIIAVIATSSGSGFRYVRQGFINLRAGMFLEVATTAGASRGPLSRPSLLLPGWPSSSA